MKCFRMYCVSLFNIICYVSFEKRFDELLKYMQLPDREKQICRDLYIERVRSLNSQYSTLMFIHFSLHITVITGSILVPSLMALQKITFINEATSIALYWIAFILSILLMIANKLLYAFNIDRRYISTKENIRKHYNEGWQFATRVLRYAKCIDDITAFKLFCSRLSKMEEKSIELIPAVEKIERDNNHFSSPPPRSNSEINVEPITPTQSV